MVISSASIVILFSVYLYLAKQKLANDLSFILISSLFLISLFFPTLTIFVEPITWRNLDGMTNFRLGYLQWQYFCFLFGCFIFYVAIGYRLDGMQQRRVVGNAPNSFTVGKRTFISFFLVLIGSLLYAYFIYSVGLGNLISPDVLSEKYELSSGKGIFYIGLNLIILGVLISEHHSVSRKITYLSRIIAVCVVVWALGYIHTRTYAAILFLGYFSIFVSRNEIKVVSIKFKYVILGAFFWGSLEIFSLARSFISASGGMQLADMSVFILDNMESAIAAIAGGSDFSHPFITFFELSINEEPASFLGQGFVDGIKSLLPAVLVDYKPPTTAQWFVAKYYPDFAAIGGGAASSLVGEVWLNLGAYVGPFLSGLIISFAIFIIQVNAKWNENGICNMLIPYFTLTVLLFERVGLVATFKQVVFIAIPLLGLYVLFIILSKRACNLMENTKQCAE